MRDVMVQAVKEVLLEHCILFADLLHLLWGLWVSEMLPVLKSVCFSDAQTSEAVVEPELMSWCKFHRTDRNDGTVVFYGSYNVGKSVKFCEFVRNWLLVF